MANGGAAIIIQLVKNIAYEPLKSQLCVCAIEQKKRFLRVGVFAPPFSRPWISSGPWRSKVVARKIAGEGSARNKKACSVVHERRKDGGRSSIPL
jgi:hypothetical protein